MTRSEKDILKSAEPYLDELLEVARHDLKYHEARGELEPGDLTPEEVLGEVLIAASDGWDKKPRSVPARLWLFRLEDRVMHGLIAGEEEARSRWAFSMEEPVPELPAPFSDDVYWDWNQPDEADRWEDTLFGFEGVGEELIEAAEDASRGFDPVQRRAWLLYGRFDFSIPDIARVVHRTPHEVALMLRDAGEAMRERLEGNGPEE